MSRLSHTDMAHQLGLLAAGKSHWLTNFAEGRNKRPDHEIEMKRRELAALMQAREDYKAAAERSAA